MAKVMLAEDDLTMVNLLKTLLKMEGYEVIAIEPDADVLKEMRRVRPDILLLDVHLSGRNGLDILDVIRKTRDVANERVIMTSGMNLKEECLDHGADDFLLKPYMPDDLIFMLKSHINPVR